MFDQREIARSQKVYHMYWIENCELNARLFTPGHGLRLL